MELPLLSVLYSSLEIRNNPDYFWDNSHRPHEPVACVIQRTKRGASYIEEGTNRRIARAGEAILFQYGEDSRYGIPDRDSLPYEHEWVCISGKQAPGLFRGLLDHVGRRVAMPEGSQATRLLQTIIEKCEQRSFEDRFHESTMAYSLLMACFRLPSRQEYEDDVARLAMEFILNHYQHPFSQEDLADHLGLSREHVSRRFREVYGVSPGRYCNQLRMNRAKDLLKVSFAPIAEVALQCGYADANSFSRALKQYYNRSPREMRAGD